MNLLKNYKRMKKHHHIYRELEKLQLLLTTMKTTLIDTENNPLPDYSYLSSVLVSFKNITEKLQAYIKK